MRVLGLIGVLVGAVLVALWLTGGFDDLHHWAAQEQRRVQNAMAAALRRLQAGEPGATAALLSLCFGYGFFHAVGPGHGKLVIGSYGLGAAVPFGRLATLSVLSSLAQAGTAVLLVWGGITLLDLGREALTDLAENRMNDLGTLLIGLVGVWLAVRGVRLLRAAARPVQHHHHHHHHHDAPCGCGHAHGPTPEQVAGARSWRDGALIVAAIAARPCTGALFLLILTWRMGIFATGIAGVVAMGLGTASVTLAVAGLAVWARRGGLGLIPDHGPAAVLAKWAPGVLMLTAGAIIALVATGLLI
ncbi:nickel/cobalt transporter [Paracoccus sp. (in: a-proteobacteria)]|uniref:nickel/cobalt transporter n=1 Tax=Paracoccus sp. TaxID=267 RepID=UPI0026E019EC|nr:hypothetical protein [Paracoccus sp. (in: a-proteobacteria)]MDO5647295.1 hypothetical protein [Paracoccus sp. (in: a-proteobacteria)]